MRLNEEKILSDLKGELAARKKKNPATSLRSFATQLGVSPAQLSQVLSGKRRPTGTFALQVSSRLGNAPGRLSGYLAQAANSKDEFIKITSEDFDLISEWVYLGVLSLGEIPGNRADPVWISEALGIDRFRAKSVFDRLLGLGKIELVGQGFRQKGPAFSIDSKEANLAIQSFHRSVLRVAEHRVERVEPQYRDFSTIIFEADESRIEEARYLIKEFRRELARMMKKGKKRSVYALAVQLFPLTKPIEGKR